MLIFYQEVIKLARKQRIHYKGALYHVIARGNNGEYVLAKDINKKNYIDIIKRYKERYEFNLYAYCIMDNHVHLLIEVNDTPLQKIMQGIQQVYTQKYNKENKRTGHVFQQRYKAEVCNKEGYLLHLIKYIHFNPVKAKITETVDYNWSSHMYYIRSDDSFVNTEYILKTISHNKTIALKGYKEYMMEDIEDIEPCEYRITEAQRSIPKLKETDKRLDEIIEKITEQEKVTIEELTSKSKLKKISDIRKVIIIISDKDITNKEVSKKLNISETAVSKIKTGSYKNSDSIKEMVKKYSKLIS